MVTKKSIRDWQFCVDYMIFHPNWMLLKCATQKKIIMKVFIGSLMLDSLHFQILGKYVQNSLINNQNHQFSLDVVFKHWISIIVYHSIILLCIHWEYYYTIKINLKWKKFRVKIQEENSHKNSKVGDLGGWGKFLVLGYVAVHNNCFGTF